MFYDRPAACPIDACPADDFDDTGQMHDHLLREHRPEELADRLAELARDIPFHRKVECQACGCFGARPSDHPLCRDCDGERF